MSFTVSWTVYILLLVLRICVAPFLPGYVHPDEFFQGGQELWFGCPPTIPWEFVPENALRSIVPPRLMTWLPLHAYATATLRPTGHLSGMEVLVVPRIFCAILSVLTVDFSIWRLSKPWSTTRGVPAPLLLFASAWPTMVLLCRPFSNSLETMILALLFAATLQPNRNASAAPPLFSCAATGLLFALGTFTRFTFVGFGLPILLMFLARLFLRSSFLLLPTRFGLLAGSFAIAAVAIVLVDMDFYTGSSSHGQFEPMITPWNAFQYNSKVENLAEHGLHPRWTHIGVNMFLLFGPLALLAYLSFLHPLIGKTTSRSKQTASCARRVWWSSLLVLISGLGMLSTAPHQEPRFLLPLVTPLVVMIGNTSTIVQSKLFLICWILFNTVLLTVFGVLHQSGVVQSLLIFGDTADHFSPQLMIRPSPEKRIFYHTYMPPSFLTRQTVRSDEAVCAGDATVSCHALDASCSTDSGDIIDLKGGSSGSLISTIEESLSCSTRSRTDSPYVQIVTPRFSSGTEWHFGEKCIVAGAYSCKSFLATSFHLATDDIDSIDGFVGDISQNLALYIVEVACS